MLRCEGASEDCTLFCFVHRRRCFKGEIRSKYIRNSASQETSKRIVMRMPVKGKFFWEYHIYLWDETRNTLLERHEMIVQRQKQYDALTVVRRKYPVKDGYSSELNNSWFKCNQTIFMEKLRNKLIKQHHNDVVEFSPLKTGLDGHKTFSIEMRTIKSAREIARSAKSKGFIVSIDSRTVKITSNGN